MTDLFHEHTDDERQDLHLSVRARRVITLIFALNLLAVAVLLAVAIPLGNKHVLQTVQNWSEPWCHPFGCDRG